MPLDREVDAYLDHVRERVDRLERMQSPRSKGPTTLQSATASRCMKGRPARESATGGDSDHVSLERFITQKEAQMRKKRWGVVQEDVARVSQTISDAINPLLSQEN